MRWRPSSTTQVEDRRGQGGFGGGLGGLRPRRGRHPDPGLSIRLEFQADCLAGVWAHSVWASPDQADVESITEDDVREALSAAASVGDDRIQEQASGTIEAAGWVHTTSNVTSSGHSAPSGRPESDPTSSVT